MRHTIKVFDTKPYDAEFFRKLNDPEQTGINFEFLEPKLRTNTVSLAQGADGVCIFVHDQASEEVVQHLSDLGIKLIALRCAGCNNVAIPTANELGMRVVRVPEYSPYAVAEHALALLMTLNRKTHRAYNRVRENNFALNGLMGFDVRGKTVGVVGTGRIGRIFAEIMKALGCDVMAYDVYRNEEAAQQIGFRYVPLEELYAGSDIISLHVPLTPDTEYLIGREAISQMKNGVILLNTSRGKLIDTTALIEGLKSDKIRAAGLDVYEEEEAYFFEDFSDQVVRDDELARLISFNNVVITSHQAFFTEEAMRNIASTTISNISEFFGGKELTNEIKG